MGDQPVAAPSAVESTMGSPGVTHCPENGVRPRAKAMFAIRVAAFCGTSNINWPCIAASSRTPTQSTGPRLYGPTRSVLAARWKASAMSSWNKNWYEARSASGNAPIGPVNWSIPSLAKSGPTMYVHRNMEMVISPGCLRSHHSA